MGEKGVRGKGGKEEKPDPHRQGHAVFFLRPALALSFVDSGSGMGLKLGSRAMRLRSDSSLRIVGTTGDRPRKEL
jgi:hypothetical protein